MTATLSVPGRAGAVAPARPATRPGKLPLAVLAYFTAIVLPLSVNLGPLYLTSVRLVLLVMVVPLLIGLLTGRFGRILAADILFFLHLGWTGVSLAVNSPELLVSQMGSAGVEFIGGYLLGRASIRDRADFIALVRAFGMVLVLLLPFGLIEAVTSHAPIIEALDKLPGLDSIRQFVMEKRMDLYRSKVILPHPILFGLFASLAFSLTVVGLRGILPAWRVVLTGAAVMGCVFVSLSSGALLAAVMQLILIGWYLAFRRTGRPWLLLLLAAVLAYVAIDLMSNRTPLRVFLSYATFSSDTAWTRSIIFDWGMVNVWANPVFGLGFRDWVRVDYLKGSVDNFWLLTAMRYGIPGFLLLAGGYGWGLWRVGLRDFAADPELARLRRAWMFVFTGLTFTLCTVHIWTTIHSFVFFLFGAGMWFVQARPESAEAAAPAACEAPGRAGLRYSRFPARPRRAAA